MVLYIFPQYDGEVFWRHFKRLRKFIGQGGHTLEKWEICEQIYEGLNGETRATVESMCEGNFLSKTLEEGWGFFEWLAHETYEKENALNNEFMATSYLFAHLLMHLLIIYQ